MGQITIPKIETAEEMLVTTASAVLYHSGLMLLDGTFAGPGRPVGPGHEGVGHVQQIGNNVKGFKGGDRVGFLHVDGACYEFLFKFLLRISEFQVVNILDIYTRGLQIHNMNCETADSKLHGFGRDGFSAGYTNVNYRNAMVLPDSLSMKSSDPVCCAGITGPKNHLESTLPEKKTN